MPEISDVQNLTLYAHYSDDYRLPLPVGSFIVLK